MGEEEGEVQERVDSRATKVQRFSRGAGGVLAGARAHSNKSRANARATLSTRGLYLKPPAGGRQAMLPRRSASQAIEKQAKDIPPRDIPTGPARLWLSTCYPGTHRSGRSMSRVRDCPVPWVIRSMCGVWTGIQHAARLPWVIVFFLMRTPCTRRTVRPTGTEARSLCRLCSPRGEASCTRNPSPSAKQAEPRCSKWCREGAHLCWTPSITESLELEHGVHRRPDRSDSLVAARVRRLQDLRLEERRARS